jgi:hypothetical protein
VDFEELPPQKERDWLVAELAYLVARRGRAFVDAPILEPTPAFFPDPWTPDEHGVERIARRLLNYAGLGASHVEVEIVADSCVDEDGNVIDLVSYDGVSCRLRMGSDLANADPGGRMAIVVSSAYRAVHSLAENGFGDTGVYREGAVPSPEQVVLEGKRTEVTAIYLGFGLLVANHCYRHDRDRTMVRRATTTRIRRRFTFLEPQAISYGLAVQAAARHLGWRARHALAKHLDANPAGFFDAAWAEVADRRDELLPQLGLSWE